MSRSPKARTFAFICEDRDNSRTYYRRKETGAIYCFQREARNGEPVFYVCSRDGEPESRAPSAPPEAFDQLILPA